MRLLVCLETVRMQPSLSRTPAARASSIDIVGNWDSDVKGKLELCRTAFDAGTHAMFTSFITKVSIPLPGGQGLTLLFSNGLTASMGVARLHLKVAPDTSMLPPQCCA